MIKIRRCIVCGKEATTYRGTVWLPNKKQHVSAGFCEEHNNIESNGETPLRVHIPEYKKINLEKHPERLERHMGVFCYGIYEDVYNE